MLTILFLMTLKKYARGLKPSLLFVMSNVLFLMGCLPLEQNQFDTKAEKNLGNNMGIFVAVLCPEGFALGGMDERGQPDCRLLAPNMTSPLPEPPKGFVCPEMYLPVDKMNEFDGEENHWVACQFDESRVPRTLAFGRPLTKAFSCPQGSFVQGFTAEGLAVCADFSLVPEGVGVAPQDNSTQDCSRGFYKQTQRHGTENGHGQPFSHIDVCIRDSALDQSILVGDESLTNIPEQNDFICEANSLLLGFDELGLPVCQTRPNANIDFAYFARQLDSQGNGVFSCSDELKLQRLVFHDGPHQTEWQACTAQK